MEIGPAKIGIGVTQKSACFMLQRLREADGMKTPLELDRITDVVLAYKPKPKTKAAKRRIRRLKAKSQ